MTLTEKVKTAHDQPSSLEKTEVFLKRLEKFDDIKPDETVWSEKRMLESVRSYIENEHNSFY